MVIMYLCYRCCLHFRLRQTGLFRHHFATEMVEIDCCGSCSGGGGPRGGPLRGWFVLRLSPFQVSGCVGKNSIRVAKARTCALVSCDADKLQDRAAPAWAAIMVLSCIPGVR